MSPERRRPPAADVTTTESAPSTAAGRLSLPTAELGPTAEIDPFILARLRTVAPSATARRSRATPASVLPRDRLAVAAERAAALAQLLDRFSGHYPAALAALQAGEAAVVKAGGQPPGPAARAFVQAVLGTEYEQRVPVRVRQPATGRLVTRVLGADSALPRGRDYNPTCPPERQVQNWTCAIRTTTWILRSLGHDVTAAELEERMVPGVVGNPIGLLDASGAGLARFLRDQFGLDADHQRSIAWSEVVQLSRDGRPLGLGGIGWNHWTALRGIDAQGNGQLANPSPGWMEIGDRLTPDDYARVGPFSAVWVNLPSADGRRFRVTNTQGEGVRVRQAPSLTAAVLTTLAEGTSVVAPPDSQAWRAVRDDDGTSGWVATAFVTADGGRFRVVADGAGLWLREQPTTAGAQLKLLGDGTLIHGDEFAWRHIQTEAGAGWIADTFLTPAFARTFPVG